MFALEIITYITLYLFMGIYLFGNTAKEIIPKNLVGYMFLWPALIVGNLFYYFYNLIRRNK